MPKDDKEIAELTARIAEEAPPPATVATVAAGAEEKLSL